ncbi:MAG: XRE family transcriptional regulator [Planctomycetota bacterium]
MINSEWFVVARQASGMSQSAVAKTTGISSARLSRIENGLLIPAVHEIDAIAAALGVRRELFSDSSTIRGPGTSVVHHRALRRARRRDVERVHARMALFDLQLRRLLRHVEPEHDGELIPDLSIATFDDDGAEIAREARSILRLPPGPVKTPSRVIERSGGIVVEARFLTDAVSAIYRLTPELPPMFFINYVHPGDRTRFSLAHELGHAVMHRHIGADDDRVEQQADAFAGEFLVPRDWLVDRVRSAVTVSLLCDLKQETGFSIAMLARQTANAGLISPRRFQNIMIELSKRGWRTREPIDVPRETPELFRGMVGSLRHDLGYQQAEIEHVLLRDDRARQDDEFLVAISDDDGPRLRLV